MRVWLAVLFFSLSGLSPSAAWAVYCGTRVVLPGQSQRDVFVKCGAPESTERRVYNFGPPRLIQELWFEEGRLIAIQPLGYGY